MSSSATVAADALEGGFAPPLKSHDDNGFILHPQTSGLTCSTASTVATSGSESSIDEQASSADGDGQEEYNCTLREYFTKDRTEQMNKRANEENERLNLNMGLPVDLTAFTRRDDVTTSTGIVQKVLRPPIQTLLRVLDRLLAFIESPLFRFWGERIPLRFRQKLTFMAWGMYLPIHKVLIGRRTGLHKSVSLEYHALTTMMWPGRLVSCIWQHCISLFRDVNVYNVMWLSRSFFVFASHHFVQFPVTVKRMRFSLSQLHVWHPPDR